MLSRRPSLARRSLLAAIAGSLPVAGCLGVDSPGSGDLVVRNASETGFSVAVGVQRYESDAARGDDGPAPDAESIWQRNELYSLDADETHHESGFVEAPGLHHVQVDVGGGGSDDRWVDFGSAADDGVAGPHVRATVENGGDVTVSEIHD